MSITQAAAAIVATFIGSSLITVLAFWLVLRFKRERRRRSRAPVGQSRRVDDGYQRPDSRNNSNENVNSPYNANGYMRDEKKQPFPVSPLTPTSGTTKVGSSTAGRSTNPFGDGSKGSFGENRSMANKGAAPDQVSIGYAKTTDYKSRPPPPVLSKPPAAAKKTPPPPPSATATYNVFPKKPSVSSPPSGLLPAQSAAGGGGERASGVPPNLQTWLQTASVSPFGTMKMSVGPQQPAKRDSGVKWPFSSNSPPAAKASVGIAGAVRGANAAGPGLPTQPRKLPLREG